MFHKVKMPWTRAIEKAVEHHREGIGMELDAVHRLAAGKAYVNERFSQVDKKCLELAELMLQMSCALSELSERMESSRAKPKKAGPKQKKSKAK